jgi:hypothetical protein
MRMLTFRGFWVLDSRLFVNYVVVLVKDLVFKHSEEFWYFSQSLATKYGDKV